MYPIIPVDPRGAQVLEPLGTKRKFWFAARDGRRMLFKAEERGTGEDWAEKVACELAELLGVPHVHYELARDIEADIPGVVCVSMIEHELGLAHGNQLLLDVDKQYPKDRRFRVSEHTVEAVSTVLRILDPVPPVWALSAPPAVNTATGFFIGYLMLDAFLANQDRHHENWAAIFEPSLLSLAPTFDHGASMARNLSDTERHERMITRDKQRQIAAFARRASSAFYVEGQQRPLTTIAAYRAFASLDPAAAQELEQRLSQVDEKVVGKVLALVPPERMSTICAEFTSYLLMENRARILSGELE